MDRAFLSGASATPPDAPASPSVGYPTGGDLSTAVPPTNPGAHWFYAITEEIRNVIVGAGLTPLVSSVTQLVQAIRLFGHEPGDLKMRAHGVVPTGWLECDGRAISRTTYSALFAAIGTTYGAGDGSTTFNVPDMRGEVARGWDHGRGVDPGRVLGSSQAASAGEHYHGTGAFTAADEDNLFVIKRAWTSSTTYQAQGCYGEAQTGLSATLGGSTAEVGTATTEPVGTTGDVRPRNVAVMFVIKT